MTVIESFLAFTARLGEQDRQSLEDALTALMASYDPANGFSPAELSELDRRMAEASSAIATDDDVRRIFGHTFDPE